MQVPLSRTLPRWLVLICWPVHLFSPHLRTVVVLTGLLAVLRMAGLDIMSAVGVLFLAAALATYLPGFGPGGAAAGARA